MIYGGKEIEINRNETVLDVIKDIDNTKNYFYIIKTPRCGGNRIKIGKSKTVQFEAIRCKSKELTNYSLTQSKNALSNTDDKRVWDGIKSYAYGHYKL